LNPLPHFVVIAEKGDDQAFWSIPKNQAPMQTDTTLKVTAGQFSDAEATMQMGLAEFLA